MLATGRWRYARPKAVSMLSVVLYVCVLLGDGVVRRSESRRLYVYAHMCRHMYMAGGQPPSGNRPRAPHNKKGGRRPSQYSDVTGLSAHTFVSPRAEDLFLVRVVDMAGLDGDKAQKLDDIYIMVTTLVEEQASRGLKFKTLSLGQTELTVPERRARAGNVSAWAASTRS